MESKPWEDAEERWEDAEEEPWEDEEEEGEVVYVAVGSEFDEGKATLLWALWNSSPEDEIVLVHVYHPAQMIPSMGSEVAARHLDESWVREYRKLEREKINKFLDKYLALCSKAKMRAMKLLVEMDDVGEGLLEMIAHYGVSNLVMGAAADKHYLSKMSVPVSKTASYVQQHADPSCKIWFVCKGNLICIRNSGLNEYEFEESTAIRQEAISRKSMLLRSKSSLQRLAEQEILRTSSGFSNFNTHDEGLVAALPVVGNGRIPAVSTENSTADPWESGSWNSEALDDSSCSDSDETLSSITSSLILGDEDQQFSPAHHKLEDVGITDEASKKLYHAGKEIGYLRRKLYEESCWCLKAEWDAAEAAQKAKESENLFIKEMKQRKEAEDILARQKRELEELKIQWQKVAHDHESELKLQNSLFNCSIEDMEEKLSAAYRHLSLLQSNYEKMQRERDIIVKEFELLLRRKVATTGTARSMDFSEFSYLELEKATKKFDESMKIGEGGSGKVYKGFLHHTEVAIKMLNPESMQGQSEFHQEVDVLSKMRHPHLVTLIGTCAKAWAVIYEYCSNGSLEDRLGCKGNTAPLKWPVRIRIAAEICSSLIFLHSNKPLSVVHGDLKPANILIDANFVSKLGDFGICRLLIQFNSTTPYRQTYPKGTLGYMDPEFLVSGELTPYCDVYSFGIILLRLLTGRHPPGIVKEVQEALHSNRLPQIVDPTAGDWPIMHAKQLARLALRCCESKRKRRPNLAVDAWKVLEPMKKAASRSSSPVFGSHGDHTGTSFLPPVSDLSGDHEESTSCCRWLHIRSRES